MRESGATWVVPDSMLRTSDPAFARHDDSVHFVVGETPYYVVREPEPTAIERAWNDAGSASGQLAILTLADVSAAARGPEALETFPSAATDIVLGAYDSPTRAIFFSADPTTLTPRHRLSLASVWTRPGSAGVPGGSLRAW
jgi:hypothetical protein